MMNPTDKIYIAGHNGLVGSAILRALKEKGYKNLVYRSSKELDLRDQAAVENFFRQDTFSSRLMATEAGILLFYCLQYYLFKLQEESTTTKRSGDFWMVTGLSIYVVFNFPFFLLYTSLKVKDQVNWWNIHNISYIILCIFIAKAFYVSRSRY